MKTISKITLILSLLRLVENTESTDFIIMLSCLFFYISFNHAEFIINELNKTIHK